MMDIQSFATDDFILEHLTDSRTHRKWRKGMDQQIFVYEA